MDPERHSAFKQGSPPAAVKPATTDLRENPTLVARLRRRLNYSLLGLVALAIPLGYLVAWGSYGFRLAFGQFSEWVHAVGRISTGLSQLLLLAMGVDSLSMSAASLLRVKWVVRSFTCSQAKKLLDEAWKLEDSGAVRALLHISLEEAGLGGLVHAGR